MTPPLLLVPEVSDLPQDRIHSTREHHFVSQRNVDIEVQKEERLSHSVVELNVHPPDLVDAP